MRSEKPVARKNAISLSRRDCLSLPILALGAASTSRSVESRPQEKPLATLLAGQEYGTVVTRAGQVRGYIREGTFTFKGIPYGESTGGANRFSPPVACRPWSGVRSCLSYGPICPQSSEPVLGGNEGNFLTPRNRGFQDEDCLRLNLWSPTLGRSANLPVMVFLHGGGFKAGSSQELLAYDGENLARAGEVLVVSINHRLGVLGYLDLSHLGGPESFVNAGVLDTMAALEWVHENIRNFGGDPTRVTIFGQSGGAGKVAALLAAPKAKGLFHRAIAQSGPIFKFRDPQVSQDMASRLLQTLHLKSFDLAYLQNLDLASLMRAADEATSKYHGPVFSPDLSSGRDIVGWAPVTDGQVLVTHPFAAPGTPEVSSEVPLLIGSTLNEFGNNIDDPEGPNLTDQGLRQRVKELAGTQAGAVIQAFRQRTPNATPAALWSRIASARVRNAAIEQCTRKADAKKAKVWLYWFTYQTPVLDGRPGAFHASELPFVFNNVARCDSSTGGTADAQHLADLMAGAWVAFARSGNPNHAGLPHWEPFDPAGCTTMIFDTQCVGGEAPDRQELNAARVI